MLENEGALIIPWFEGIDPGSTIKSCLILSYFLPQYFDLLLVDEIIFGVVLLSCFYFQGLEIILQLLYFIVFDFYGGLQFDYLDLIFVVQFFVIVLATSLQGFYLFFHIFSPCL